jgi:hypothetical protein
MVAHNLINNNQYFCIMKKRDTFLIKWYGPFSTVDDLKDWEEEREEVFNLYAFQAKQNKKSKYYCGMAYKQTVGQRLKNTNHHIHNFENKGKTVLQIWIGTIANIKAKETNVRICENILTSVLAKIIVGEKDLENKTNKIPPINDAYIINEWWKGDEEEIKKRSRGSLPAIIPEVMEYYSEPKSLYGINKLKHMGDL